MKIRNTFIIFIVCGFWHGANWTFIAWGVLNAIYFLPILLTKKNRRNLDTVAEGKYLPSLKEFSSIAITFGLTVIAWIFFRAENIGHALSYNYDLFTGLDEYSNYIKSFKYLVKVGSSFIFIFLAFLSIEWLGRKDQFAISRNISNLPKVFRFLIYYLLIASIFWFGGQEQQFIYFQF